MLQPLRRAVVEAVTSPKRPWHVVLQGQAGCVGPRSCRIVENQCCCNFERATMEDGVRLYFPGFTTDAKYCIYVDNLGVSWEDTDASVRRPSETGGALTQPHRLIRWKPWASLSAWGSGCSLSTSRPSLSVSSTVDPNIRKAARTRRSGPISRPTPKERTPWQYTRSWVHRRRRWRNL